MWNAPSVLLIGYSFCADVIRWPVHRLPDADRAPIGEERGGCAATQDAPDDAGLLRLDHGLVQRGYGAEEKAETACPSLADAEVIETPGGHHFDGDYDAFTHRIVDGLVRRGAWPTH